MAFHFRRKLTVTAQGATFKFKVPTEASRFEFLQAVTMAQQSEVEQDDEGKFKLTPEAVEQTSALLAASVVFLQKHFIECDILDPDEPDVPFEATDISLLPADLILELSDKIGDALMPSAGDLPKSNGTAA